MWFDKTGGRVLMREMINRENMASESYDKPELLFNMGYIPRASREWNKRIIVHLLKIFW